MISVTDYQSTYSTYQPSSAGMLKGGDTEVEVTEASDVSSLGKDDFLKLLLAELQNQNPLDPADNTEFVAQLAQFSSLEQMTQMNDNLLATLESNQVMNDSINNAMMINYFGKEVAAEANTFRYDGQDEVEFQFMLNEPAFNATIRIVNESGYTVRHVTIESLQLGMKGVKWDGLTDSGIKASDGVYTYEFEAENVDGGDVTIDPIFTGTVDGIVWKDGKANLSIDGVLIPFDKVNAITEAPVE